MARFFDVGQHAEGVIAIGQTATGVIAIGQVATGVIAIGQVARGVVAVGMGALGLVALGMGAVGILWAGGLGFGGRKGFGAIASLSPVRERVEAYPATLSSRQLADGTWKQGWIKVKVTRGKPGPGPGPRLLFSHAGKRLEVQVASGLYPALDKHLGARSRQVYGYFENRGILVCRRAMAITHWPWWHPKTIAWASGQLMLLAMMSVLFWVVAGEPLGQALFGPGGILR